MARAALVVAAALAAGLSTTAALAQAAGAAQDKRRFDVPAGPLDQALGRLGRQAGAQIAVNAELTTGLQSPGVRGSHTLPEALAQLLRGTGLQAQRDASGEYTLRRAVPASAAAPARAAAPANAATATLSAVTVLGSRDTSVPLSNVPASISLVPRDEIARQQATADGIEEILARTVPGFNPSNVGLRQIRGRTAQVFVNGVPANEQLRASTGSDINLLSPDQIDTIEAARGANSAYGFGSPGGIIALTTRRAESEQLTLKTRLGTSFNTSKPSGSLQTALYQSAAQIVGDFDYHVGIALRQDGLQRDSAGNPAQGLNSPAFFSMGEESLYDLDASLGYKLSPSGTLRLSATAGRADVDKGYDSDETGIYRQVDSKLVRVPERDRNHRRHHTLNLNYENTNIGGHAVKIEVLRSRVHTLKYSPLEEGIVERDDQTNEYSGLRSSVTTQLPGLRSGASLSYGLDYLRNRYFRPLSNDATGELLSYVSPAVTLQSWAPYLQGQLPLGDWRFLAGLRHERYGGSVATGASDIEGSIEGGDIRAFSLSLFNAGAVYTLKPGRELYASFSASLEI